MSVRNLREAQRIINTTLNETSIMLERLAAQTDEEGSDGR